MTDSKASWTEYWRSGQTQCCFCKGDAVNIGAIWRRAFDAIPEGSAILDLATGAGAVLQDARRLGRGFRLVGVDFVDEVPGLDGAEMRGGVDLEELPFEDGAFDMVVSQFGFEYAARDAAAAEAMRVLACGGRLALLMHADNTPPVQASRDRIARAEGLIGAHGLVTASAKLAEMPPGSQASNALGEDIRGLFQKVVQGDRDETVDWALSFLNEVLTHRPTRPKEYAVENIRTLMDILGGYRDRMAAMVEAALGTEDVEALFKTFERDGLREGAIEPVISEGDQIGWWFTGVKV